MQLNPNQRKAVETTQGPVLILAGAGSGKTRALSHRIANLIEHGVSPRNILALTFTNKAANEMKQRVKTLCGTGGDVWISTFHSCCARILRMDIARLGYTKDFVIYDDADQLSVIAQIIKQLQLDEEMYPRRQLRSAFSDAKNRAEQPYEYIASGEGVRSAKIAEAFLCYEKLLRKNNALDFDDLLLRVLELFNTCPDVLEKYQDRFMYIHVDEYQDTNAAQYQFLRLLSGKHKNICVVGDDDQSIYGWRGADIRNILEFERDFKNAAIIKLEQNYRSTGNILAAANAVISNNIERKKKKLWTSQGDGEKLTRYTAWSEREEAEYVCRTVQDEVARGGSYSCFAVLYRTNAQSRMFEEYMTGYGIPYIVHGALKFYDRKEIKDVLAYLRLMVNPRDEVSLRRAINVPKRGIGEGAVAELAGLADERGTTLMDAVLDCDRLPLGRAKHKIKAFSDLMKELLALSALLPLAEFTGRLLEIIGYMEYLQDNKKEESASRVENVLELLGAIAEFEKTAGDDALSAFLENVALVANVADDPDASAVSIMTLHAAKGLEFPTVFICGMEESVFPTSRAWMEEAAMEEERRLCYVGMTRAMEKLYLLRASSRMLYNKISNNQPSRFLGEISPEYFDDAERVQPPKSEPKQSKKQVVPLWEAPQATAPVSRGNDYVFEVFMRVEHAKFGRGTVLEVNNGVLTIDFDDCGVKKIVASFAPVKPLE